jgi:hypothetical protein
MHTSKNETELTRAYALEPEPIYPDAFRWLDVERLKRARIASNLAPRARRHLGEKTRCYVVGYDCPNLTKRGYTEWEKFLVAACQAGCKISYYLGKTSEPAMQRFHRIATESQARRGQIKVYVRDREGSRIAESYANQWKTFHFVIFENPRQLWIETNHPQGKTEAYNCYYLPPAKAKNEPLLDLFKSRFQMVVQECAGLQFQS